MQGAGHKCSVAVLADGRGGSEGELREFARQHGIIKYLYHQIPKRNPALTAAKAFLTGQMYFMERYQNNRFRTDLKALVDDVGPEVIHFDIITMCQYRDVAGCGVRTVASINDSYTLALDNLMRSQVYKGVGYLYRLHQRWQSRNYERVEYSKFDAVHVMSEVDKKYLIDIGCISRIYAIPNGVDDSMFVDCVEAEKSGLDAVFVANITGQNLQILRAIVDEVWPKIISEVPGINLRIVGKVGDDAKELHARWNGKSGIIFEGFVKDLHSVYRKCGIALVPIDKNCGLVNKAIEAMAASLAVVGYQSTFSGISEAREGVHFRAAKSLADFARVVIDIVQHTDELAAMRRAAATLARERYRWSSRLHAFESMYSPAITESRTEFK